MIAYKAGYKYQLADDYRVKVRVYPPQNVVTEYICLSVEGTLYIRCGYAWDGASGPTIDTRNSMRASLVHDALYQLIRLEKISSKWRDVADSELERLCKEDGMTAIRAALWRKAVQWFASDAAKPSAERPVLYAP